MADFKTADICGASPNLNGVLEKMDSLKNSLSSSLTVDPSALASTLSSEVSSLSSSLSGMIPELPSAPDVSLQAELTSLSKIDLSLPSGALAYKSKLDSIKSQFGDSLTNAGFSLDDLVSQVAPLNIPSVGGLTDAVSGAVSSLTGGVSGAVSDLTGGLSGAVSDLTGGLSGGGSSVDLCSVVPNFKLPDGATEAVESAAETLMADAPGVAEKLSEVTANAEVVTIQADLKRVVDAVADGTAYTKASVAVEIKSKDINQNSVKVARVKDNLSTTTEEVDGRTITKRERPRTVDTSVAQYFDKPVRKVKSAYVAFGNLPKVGFFGKGAYKDYETPYSSLHQLGENQIKLTALSGPTHNYPKTYPDGTIKEALVYNGKNIVETFTDTNIQVYMPVEILRVYGIPKNILTKSGYLSDIRPLKGKIVEIPYTFKKGSGLMDNYIVLENANAYAYVSIKYNKGGNYNGNYRDEALDIIQSGSKTVPT